MIYNTLISTHELATRLEDPEWAIVDCRFSLADTERGRRDYLTGHIPHAVYAHLDEDLSGPIIPGQTGRHPLPDPDALARRLGGWGIGPGVQVVAYDDAGGSIAARLWWLLHWLGHEAAAVLDGGWPAWQRMGGPARAGIESRSTRTFSPNPRAELLVDSEAIERLRTDPGSRVIDSRTADRFRGENETLDPVAGHIPGAICAPYPENLTEQGMFLTPEELRGRFQSLVGDVSLTRMAFYCGSGVTAAHNLLALAYAGLGEARLYAGSWSEWITDPDRPIAK